MTIPYNNFAEFLCTTYNKERVVFCTEYCRGNIQYRCHPFYDKMGAFYDWTLVQYDDGELYPCKLVACIPGAYNNFDGYELIIQETYAKNNTGSVLFTDYKFSQDLVKISADCVQGPCFVVESNINNGIVLLAFD